MKHTIYLLLLLALCLSGTPSTAQIITTYAGNGTAAFSGDGAAATLAELSGPAAVACDTKGNLYIADAANNRIRKVTTAGIITTIAGTGTAGYNGDGIAATAAELSNPIGVATDAYGNVYIADNGSFRVRRVDTLGIITTIAGIGGIEGFGYGGDGGPATSAHMYVYGLAVDKYQNVYIADGNTTVRKVSHTTGIITTVAGSTLYGYSGDGGPATSAALAIPTAVAVDTAGNIFIADNGNNRLRIVYAAAGIITTFAGNGTSGSLGDNGPANAATVVPFAVATDAAGNVYIADQANNRIRMVNLADTINTIAGTGTAGFSGDGGLATLATLHGPSGIALDGFGNYYIADNYNNRVRKVSGTGSPVHICAGSTMALTYGSPGGTWSSSGTVATVGSTGIVTGIAPGTDTIYFMAGADTAIRTPVVVDTLPAVGPISGADSVCAGAAIGLTTTTTGGVWVSSNTSLATIYSTGALQSLAPGTDTVTYTVSDAACTSTASHIITILALPSAGTITGTDSICPGDTLTLSASVPGGAWASSNASLATILTAGQLIGIAPGTDTISYTVTQAGCSSTTAYTISVRTPASCADTTIPSSVATIATTTSINIYPNPTTGSFTITGTWQLPTDAGVTITITDLLGRTVSHGIAPTTQGQMNEQIGLGNALPNGIYMVQLLRGTETKIFHFVMQH